MSFVIYLNIFLIKQFAFIPIAAIFWALIKILNNFTPKFKVFITKNIFKKLKDLDYKY